MKKINLVACVLSVLLASSAVFAQKVKYKEIKPLLAELKYNEALPKLITYYQQNTKDGEWTSKAILMEMDNMFDASKAIASIYETKSIQQKSFLYADSSIYWYNIMITDKHPDAEIAQNKIKTLKSNQYDYKNFEKEKSIKQENIKQKQLDSIKNEERIIQAEKSNTLWRIKEDSLNKMQKILVAQNTGTNDPMIVAKKYAEAYIKGDMETLIKFGYKDSITGAVGMFKKKTIDAYKADKTKFTQQVWKDEVLEVLKNKNLRISQDFRGADYKKKTCDRNEPDEDVTKPLIKVRYRSEKEVSIDDILTYDYEDRCKYLGNEQWTMGIFIHHKDIWLVKVKGKWFVSYLN